MNHRYRKILDEASHLAREEGVLLEAALLVMVKADLEQLVGDVSSIETNVAGKS